MSKADEQRNFSRKVSHSCRFYTFPNLKFNYFDDSLLPSSLSVDFSTKQRPKPIFKKPLGKPLLQQQDHSILEEMDTHDNEENVSNPIKNRLLNILHLSNSYFVTRLFKVSYERIIVVLVMIFV
jgi:hypothetical protein